MTPTATAVKSPANAPLTVAAPSGAHFRISKVGPKGGAKTAMPVLTWDNLDACVSFMGEEAAVLGLSGGLTSKYREIARQGAADGKTQDEVAMAQIEYRPVAKAPRAKTKPAATRIRVAARAMARAFTKEQAAVVAVLLEDLAAGKTVIETEEEVALLRK